MHTMDSSWRRRHTSSCNNSKRKVPLIRADPVSWMTPLNHDYSIKGGCVAFPRAFPLATAGDAILAFSSEVDQQRQERWKETFPLHRVGELSHERVDGGGLETAAVVGALDGVFPAAMREVGDVGSTTISSSASSRGVGEEEGRGDKGLDWREGLGHAARVLALSVSRPQK